MRVRRGAQECAALRAPHAARARALPSSPPATTHTPPHAVVVDDIVLDRLSRDSSITTMVHIPPLDAGPPPAPARDEGAGLHSRVRSRGVDVGSGAGGGGGDGGSSASASRPSAAAASSAARSSSSSSSAALASVSSPAPLARAKRPRLEASRSGLPACVAYADPALAPEALEALAAAGSEVAEAAQELYDVKLTLRLLRGAVGGAAGGGAAGGGATAGRIEFSFEGEQPATGKGDKGPAAGAARVDMVGALIARMLLKPGSAQAFLDTFALAGRQGREGGGRGAAPPARGGSAR